MMIGKHLEVQARWWRGKDVFDLTLGYRRQCIRSNYVSPPVVIRRDHEVWLFGLELKLMIWDRPAQAQVRSLYENG